MGGVPNSATPLVEALVDEPVVAPDISAKDAGRRRRAMVGRPDSNGRDVRVLSPLDRPFVDRRALELEASTAWIGPRPPKPKLPAIQRYRSPRYRGDGDRRRTTDDSVWFWVPAPVARDGEDFLLPNWTAQGPTDLAGDAELYGRCSHEQERQLQYSTTTAENLGRAGTAAACSAWPRSRRGHGGASAGAVAAMRWSEAPPRW